MEINFNNSVTPCENDLFVLFVQDIPAKNTHILLEWDGERITFPNTSNLKTTELHYIGSLLKRPIWCGYISEYVDKRILQVNNSIDKIIPADTLKPGQKFITRLRMGLGLLNDEQYEIACRASIISHWISRHKFCGVCRSPLQLSDTELAMTCRYCSETYYPQIAPAIIVAVHRHKQILMVKSKRSLSDFYGLVAGYVEAGESLESAVHREVKEETNLEIQNVRYVKSQSWPFPNSQMLAFTADYKAGSLCIQKEELTDARWFKASEIPPMPPKLSVGRFLVEEFIREANL